jgi:adenylate cyclase class 2
MTEVEVKLPILDADATRRGLSSLGFEPVRTHHEVDTYFQAPHRDFGQTDEALRIRQIGECAILTYKGPKQGNQGKVRTEIEVPMASGPHDVQDLHCLLHHLGFRDTRVVVKQRTFYRNPALPDLEVGWDEVGGLGTFLELEAKVSDGSPEHALSRLQAIARGLGLGPEERRSYLEMLLAAAK